MKKLIAITLLTILSTVCIFAQHGANEQGLIGLDKQWSAAIDRRDSNSIDALNGVTADDLTSRGGTEHKAPYIEPTLKGGLQTFSITTLQVRTSYQAPSDDPDALYPDGWIYWGADHAISEADTLFFRWRTLETGVTSARWQVTDSPNGFSGNFNIIASGKLFNWGEGFISGIKIFTPGTWFEFKKDFSQFLPVSPPMSPKDYYVRIIPINSPRGQSLKPSPSVKITYEQPPPPPR